MRLAATATLFWALFMFGGRGGDVRAATTDTTAVYQPPFAFTGAEGWGADTPGGRGGRILFVTTLADGGPGSLREALRTPGRRTVLFRVSGVIRLDTPILLSGGAHDFLTLAGQSAPGGGITITGQPLVFDYALHDVVIRHLRFRATGDGLSVHNGCARFVFDHCSFSWAWDENLDLFLNTTDVTVSHCIFAEGLRNGGHPDGPHSCGLLIGKGTTRVSIHHCFFTGNDSRNPAFCGGDTPAWRPLHVIHPVFDFRNNLTYNCAGGQTSAFWGPHVNVVGCVWLHGLDTIPHIGEVHFSDVDDADGSNAGNRFYVSDNIGPHVDPRNPFSVVYDEAHQVHAPRPGQYRLLEPIPAPPVTTLPAHATREYVLTHAGAQPHDATDERLVAECRAGTGACGAPTRTRMTPFPPPAAGAPAPDGDNDGMPDAWELAYDMAVDEAGNAWADPDRDGYGNLEEYLNGTNPVAANR